MNLHTPLIEALTDIDTDAAETAFADGRLRQAQLKMFAMLMEVDRICQKYHLDYWLDAGSLLGAIRHQGFIPWDDDMDIAMPRASYETFLKVAPAEIPEFMWLQTAKTDPGFFNMATPLKIRDRTSCLIEKHETGEEPYVQGIFIDVFVYDRMPVNKTKRHCFKWAAKKISRLLSAQYSVIPLGHYSSAYQVIGRFLSTSFLERCLQALIVRANNSGSEYLGRGFNCVGRNVIAETDLYPLQRAQFETGTFNVPMRPEVVLTQQYGDYLTLPPESERVMRHCRRLNPNLI